MPMPPPPVVIHSCVYWRVTGGNAGRGTTLRTLGVRIAYRNESNEPLTGVTFLVKTDNKTEYVTDNGLFSPNVQIVHQFYTTYVPYYDAKTQPDTCRVVRVRFANGAWGNVERRTPRG